MIHKFDLDDIVEDKNDDNLFFLYCTFYGKDSTYEQFHMCLYDIEDHTYAHSQGSFGTCSDIRLLGHKSLEFVPYHTYRAQQHLPYTCMAHNGRYFCTCDHKEVIYCKDYYIQEQEYHRQ